MMIAPQVRNQESDAHKVQVALSDEAVVDVYQQLRAINSDIEVNDMHILKHFMPYRLAKQLTHELRLYDCGCHQLPVIQAAVADWQLAKRGLMCCNDHNSVTTHQQAVACS